MELDFSYSTDYDLAEGCGILIGTFSIGGDSYDARLKYEAIGLAEWQELDKTGMKQRIESDVCRYLNG